MRAKESPGQRQRDLLLYLCLTIEGSETGTPWEIEKPILISHCAERNPIDGKMEERKKLRPKDRNAFLMMPFMALTRVFEA